MESVETSATERGAIYRELMPQLSALVEGELDLVANLGNIAAALKQAIGSASWVGFYILRSESDTELVLGPFQGKVACTRIALGRGVCGTAAAERRIKVVRDVEQFPGHIACDAGSRSEVVVPLLRDGTLLGVLDLDSYDVAAFDHIDAEYLKKVAGLAATLPGWH